MRRLQTLEERYEEVLARNDWKILRYNDNTIIIVITVVIIIVIVSEKEIKSIPGRPREA